MFFNALPALNTGIRSPFKSVTTAKVPKPPISTSSPFSSAMRIVSITALTERYALVLLNPLRFETSLTNSCLFTQTLPCNKFYKFPFVKGYVPPAGLADSLLRTVSYLIGQNPMHLYHIQRKKLFQNFLHIQRRGLLPYQKRIAYSDYNAGNKINIVPVIISQQIFGTAYIFIFLNRQ